MYVTEDRDPSRVRYLSSTLISHNFQRFFIVFKIVRIVCRDRYLLNQLVMVRGTFVN